MSKNLLPHVTPIWKKDKRDHFQSFFDVLNKWIKSCYKGIMNIIMKLNFCNNCRHNDFIFASLHHAPYPR